MSFAAWAVALIILARALRGPRRHSVVPLAALCVALIALLHSAIDFSLQITGYAVVAFAIVGVGLAQSYPANESSSQLLRSRRVATQNGPGESKSRRRARQTGPRW